MAAPGACKGGYKPPVEIWAAVRRPRGFCSRRGLVQPGCTPHFLFETSKRKCAAPGGKENMFGGSVCAGADLLPPAGEGWQSRAAVRDGNARPLGNPSARGCPGYIQLLFSLPLAVPRGNWRSGLIKASAPTEIPSALRILWGPTCVSALARVTKATSPVGADALVRPPAQAATTAQAARSDCAAVGGSAVLRMRRAPCGQAERAEGGASGTLVTEIRGAPQRETGKEERFKCARVLQSKTHYAAGIRR